MLRLQIECLNLTWWLDRALWFESIDACANAVNASRAPMSAEARPAHGEPPEGFLWIIGYSRSSPLLCSNDSHDNRLSWMEGADGSRAEPQPIRILRSLVARRGVPLCYGVLHRGGCDLGLAILQRCGQTAGGNSVRAVRRRGSTRCADRS